MLHRSPKFVKAALLVSAVVTGVGALVACSDRGAAVSSSAADTLASARPKVPWFAQPAWASSGNNIGTLPADQIMEIQVHLKTQDDAAAAAELAAVSDPTNPAYGQFLTSAQWNAKYAPTAASVATVRSFLESNGLVVTYIPSNNAFITATGSTAQLSGTFATSFALFRLGSTVRHAPVVAPNLPPDVSALVLGVLGLTSPVQMQPHPVQVGGIDRDSVSPNATAAGASCSEWFGQVLDTTDPPYASTYPQPLSYAPCGYRPAQLRQAYGFDASVRAGNDGTGVTIAIVDAYMSPTLLQDAQTYAAQNDPDYPLATSQFTTQMGPGTVGKIDRGWYSEQTLDVEAVHTMAPGANIVAIGAVSANDQDLVAAINMIVTQNLASVISNSYGSPEGEANDFVIWNAMATQAGLQGVGLFFSSGDSGDEAANLGFPSPDFPASLPNVTAVGGTSLALGQTGQTQWEVGWETGVSRLEAPAVADAGAAEGGGGVGVVLPPVWTPAAPGSFAFGAGGGTSSVYGQPAYQVGIVPTALANLPGAPARVVPDVAMLADPMTGFLIGQTGRTGAYGESVIGGTSLACPLFTATIALAQQNAGRSFGFANPLLYQASTQGAFRDIAPGASPQAVAVPGGVVTTFEYPNLAIQTAVGYDNVTGLGVPNGATFLQSVQ